MNKPLNTPAREFIWDTMRGLAAFMMVLSHAIFFFSREMPIGVTIISRTLNTLTVTFFFVTAGAAAALNLSSHTTYIDTLRAGFKRTIILFITYLLTAGTAVILQSEYTAPLPTSLISVVTLQHIPNFTEFFIPLLFIPLTFTVFRPITVPILRSIWLTCITAISLYVVGMWLYTVPVSDIFAPYKALFSGNLGYLRFPILQYSSVFLLGGWFALTGKAKQMIYAGRITKIGICIIGACIALIKFVPAGLISPPFRWPPSFSFLGLGVVAYFAVFILLSIGGKGSIYYNRVLLLLNNAGKYTLLLYITHIIFLFVYTKYIGYTFYSSINTLIISFIFALITICIGYLKKNTLIYQSNQQSVSVFSFAITLWSLFAVLIIINANPYNSPYGGIWRYAGTNLQNNNKTSSGKYDPTLTSAWYHREYGYRRSIHIRVTDREKPANPGDTIGVQFDHAALVLAKKSAADGSDLQVTEVRNGEIRVVPSRIIFPNTAFAVLKFTISDTILPGDTNTDYALYYGSEFPEAGIPLSNDKDGDSSPSAFMQDEETAPLLLTSNRRWYIKAPGYDLIPISVSDNTGTSDGRYTYTINSSGTEIPLPKISGNVQIEQIPIQTLPIGKHSIRVTKHSSNSQLYSRTITVIVSEPVYVAWTLDWEGWDVPDNTLSELEAISVLYDRLPITHFFNPRIYLTTIMPPIRAQVLTDWVKQRAMQNNDEIALHLHMHFDVVQAAGIEPRINPKWGYRSSEGYDVYTTAYTQAEISQILRWSLQQFAAHNLPKPIGYRAGGWFVNTSVLAALEENGFLYDSSGRTQSLWGGIAKSPWNLDITAQPFYPSRNDQNTSTPPNFSVLEIPNTAGDSNEYTATELIRRYNANVNEEIVSKKTAIVLLSHPQWAEKEFPTIRTVLSTIHLRSYKKDMGPVIFVPVRSIYDQWK